jgi:protease II
MSINNCHYAGYCANNNLLACAPMNQGEPCNEITLYNIETKQKKSLGCHRITSKLTWKPDCTGFVYRTYDHLNGPAIKMIEVK